MQPDSPLEYSRDQQRVDHENRGKARGELPPKANTPTLYETVERALERIQARSVFNPRGRTPAPEHNQSAPEPDRTDIPRRPKRALQPTTTVGLHLRPEEQKLLVEVGKFRVIAVSDLAKDIYKGQENKLRCDLRFLKQNGLVDTHFINRRRDGRSEAVRRFEVVTLTRAAQKMLSKSGLIPEGQRIYSGLVKPREVEHDSHIFRAYLKEAAAIEAAGGRNLRVKLDFELKAQLNRAMYLAGRANRNRSAQEIKAEVAEQFNLTIKNNKVVIPDLRIEYDLPSGGSAQMDVEVATSAYRHGHIAHKAQAGFRMYVSNGDIGRLGAAIRDDHDLMAEILDL